MPTKKIPPEKLTRSSPYDRAFLNMFESNSAIMLLIDPKTGRILDANPAAVEFYGYPKVKLCGMPVVEINCLPAEQVVAERQKAKDDGQNVIVIKQRLASGAERTVEELSSNLVWQGKPVLFLIMHDITGSTHQPSTNLELVLQEEVRRHEIVLEDLRIHQIELEMQNVELRRTQAELDAERARYFDLYDLAPMGYCTLNTEGLILEANLTAANLLGLTRAAMLNLPMSRFIEKNSQDQYYFRRKKFVETGTYQVDELQMVKQDGTIFWAQVEISYSLGDKKEYQARILISDISERKRIENLLQITEKRLSVLAEYSRVIFWEVDAEGLYNYISPTCLSILGYTSVEISAKKYFYDLHPDEGRAAFKVAAFEQIDRQLPFRNFENMLQTKDGQVIWVSTNALPILDENGKLTGYSGVDIDITEHKLVAAAVVEREASKREQAALAKADAERRLLLDNIQTQVWYLTDDHTYGRVNVAHAAFIGVSKERLAFKSMYDFVQNDRLDHFIQDVKQVFATGQAIHSELRLPNADGEWRLLKILTSAILNADGLVRQVVCSADDITERKQAEEALRYAHWKLESTIEGTHVGTWEWNVQTGETTFNEIWAQMLGYSLAELAPISIKTWEMLTHPDDLIRSGELLAHHFMGKSLYYECEPRMKHKDGHWVWIQDRGRVVTWTEDNKPLLILGIHTDISVRKASEEKIRLLNIELENLTLTDFLTNLFNRRYFMLRGTEAVKRVMRNTEPLSLLMLDIDLFKKVNDNYGHEVGDLALQHVARVLKSCLREIDILARIGGEEFAVLLPNMGQAEAAILAERVRKLIQDTPFETGGKAIAITISLGAAVFENGMAAIDDLLRNADAALYEAKRSGRNCVVIFGDNLPPPTEGK